MAGDEFSTIVDEAVRYTQQRVNQKIIDHVEFDFTNSEEVYAELSTGAGEIASMFQQEIDTLRADISFSKNVWWEGHWDGEDITWTSTTTEDGCEPGFKTHALFTLSRPGTDIAPSGSFGEGLVDKCRASGRISMIQQIDFNFKSLHHS